MAADGAVRIASPIHLLPFNSRNEALYGHIQAVFQEMVPMFARVSVLVPGVETTLQVVVKAQCYHLLPGMSYKGKWHVEGETERIVAAGAPSPKGRTCSSLTPCLRQASTTPRCRASSRAARSSSALLKRRSPLRSSRWRRPT